MFTLKQFTNTTEGIILRPILTLLFLCFQKLKIDTFTSSTIINQLVILQNDKADFTYILNIAKSIFSTGWKHDVEFSFNKLENIYKFGLNTPIYNTTEKRKVIIFDNSKYQKIPDYIIDLYSTPTFELYLTNFRKIYYKFNDSSSYSLLKRPWIHNNGKPQYEFPKSTEILSVNEYNNFINILILNLNAGGQKIITKYKINLSDKSLTYTNYNFNDKKILKFIEMKNYSIVFYYCRYHFTIEILLISNISFTCRLLNTPILKGEIGNHYTINNKYFSRFSTLIFSTTFKRSTSWYIINGLTGQVEHFHHIHYIFPNKDFVNDFRNSYKFKHAIYMNKKDKCMYVRKVTVLRDEKYYENIVNKRLGEHLQSRSKKLKCK